MHRLARRVKTVLGAVPCVMLFACTRVGAAPDATASGISGVRSPAGRWEGIARVPGSAPLRLSFTLDSTAGAWHGSLLAPAMDTQPVPFASITYVRGHRARYDSVRAANVDIGQAEPGIRGAFRKLKAIYPPAVFPDVYFVVGRFNSEGTSTRHGLLIGAEMYREPSRLPAIVAHELIHFQQNYESPTLLENAFKEGSADFVGEMISGTQINNAAHEYGMKHEHELWREFMPHFNDRSFYPWMYGRPSDGRPSDLGYFIGYRIAQAYYDRMTNKRQAISDIITGNGGDVEALLTRSGYDP